MVSSVLEPHPPARSMTHTWRSWIAIVLTVLAVGSGIATALGLAPWLFLMFYGAAGTYVAAPRVGWARGLWSTVLIALFVASWVLVVDPYVRVRLDIAMIVLLCVVLVVAFGGLLKQNRATVLTLPRALESGAILVPAAATAVIYYGAALLRGVPLGWAMQGDAQFNTVLSRQVGAADGQILDGGQVLSLAQGLMAAVHLPGRSGVSADDLLLHDVARQADLWIILILLSSVLAGSIAELVLRDSSRPIRIIGILAAGVLPLTWHMTGYAMSSGFYNVSLAFLALELSFYFWMAVPRSPLLRSTILLAMAIVTLGAWTPLAAVPAALAAWSAWVGWRQRPSRRAIILWSGATLQFVVFVAVFILPGFLAKSSVLSAAGAILPLSRHLYVSMSVAAIFLAVIVATRRPSAFAHEHAAGSARHFGVGLALLAVSAGVGTGFLIVQNRHLSDYWNYYPIKFAWISMELLVLLVFLGCLLVISTLRGQRLLSIVATGSVSLILISLLQLNPPPNGGLTAFFPILGVAKNDLPADATLSLLSSVSGEKVYYYRYSTLEQDTFMNQWQFQITAKDEFTPIRSFAYVAVSTPTVVCDAAQAWGGGVTVVTRGEFTAEVLNERCGDVLTAITQEPLQ